MDHIGIDVHKRESQIYILAEGGEVIERRIRTEPERFDAVLGTRPRARIVIEASTDSEWVARCLEALGHEVIVADPNFAPMYATRTRKVKTDRRDARALAEACLLGAYRPAHRLSDPQRHVRGRLVVRDALVRTRTRYISIIRALLRQHGYRVPSGSAEHFVHRVQGLPLPGRLRSVVAPAARPHASPQRAAHVLRRHDRTPRRPGSPRAAPALRPQHRPRHRRRLPRRHRRCPPLPPRASARSLPRPRARRVQLGRDAAARRDHQGRPLAHPLAPDSGRRLDPPPPSAAGGGRCGPGPCASPRAGGNRWPWSPSPVASPASSMRCCAMAACSSPSAFGSAPSRVLEPPPPWACEPRRRCPDDAGPGLSQVRWVGERECRLGRRCRAAA